MPVKMDLLTDSCPQMGSWMQESVTSRNDTKAHCLDVILMSLLARATMCKGGNDFYATLPFHNELPFDYWIRLNKAIDTAEGALKRQGKILDNPAREVTVMFIRHCPDPWLALVFKCKPLEEWTTGEVQSFSMYSDPSAQLTVCSAEQQHSWSAVNLDGPHEEGTSGGPEKMSPEFPTLIVDGQGDDLKLGSNVIKHLIHVKKASGDYSEKMLTTDQKHTDEENLLQLLSCVEKWKGGAMPEKMGPVKVKHAVMLEPMHEHLVWGVEILDPGEVVYTETRTNGVVGRGVILECGPTLPDVYIWGFTRPRTDTIRAIVYNFGKGPKLQKLAQELGELSVITNSASLSIEKLPLVAEGVYTCQALYDTAEGAKLYYYYVYLSVLVPVSKPYILMSDSSPVEGSTLWMRCGLENGTGPIKYIWEQESRSGMLTMLAEGNSSLVNVTDISRNHTGWYRCLASNQVNQQRSDRIWLDIIYGPDLPQIDVTPYSVTERGYSALERETVSLLCQASSNPPSQYVWFYNNSQVYSGPQYTITRILRMHTGHYACLALNTYLNTRSKKTITLTVYYPPDGNPSCTILPANNHTDLALWCHWAGGYPPASLHWNPFVFGEEVESGSNITQIQPGPETANNSVFVCQGSHVALNITRQCSTRTWLPVGEPQCSAYATRNNEYLMLSCSWEGGFPRALLWWASSSGASQGTSEENANILVLRSSYTYSGKAFVCHAKHPLAGESKQCVLRLEAPVLVAHRSLVTVYEGSDVQLTCVMSANYPVTEITWYNNLKQHVDNTPKKYVLQRAASWSNLTVRETDCARDSGQYWCSATNAVGGAEIPITLLVKRYPMPPNVTINKIVYSSHVRTDVDMEWSIRTELDLTSFFIERQLLPEPVGKRASNVSLWYKVIVDLESDVRSCKISGLDPTRNYAFRITAVNHRTIGHPSEVKSPADPPFNAYPAVIGSAIGGMILATVATVLFFLYVVRNRRSNPRLHDLIFGLQHSQSRENINFPEDEVVGGLEDEAGGRAPSRSPSPGPSMTLPRPTAAPKGSPIGEDNEPVNVTITVMATS
ncbi:V-set and immunoglobulin domain-containing protein 10-like 2 [Chanos chanos]|uniref:V-set and immunoglobulin domain-containing protein 10-like 2 n=1 Tax=Chanos chanos TaxID=29144 RepID=UPI0011F4040D|nr:V-set and immunoglobulin domain-containing protein 10-like 2 [Chanos chanos]